MPECYTYVYLANQALTRSGNAVASQPAFIAGANGPNPLYMYRIYKKKREPNLPALAARMHREKTGQFLHALIRYATTPAQQSYALGFITHYTTDCTLYPYMAAMSVAGAPYAGEQGRYEMACALDSTLYHRDYKTLLVPLHAATPVLITEELAQVCALLREAVADVYQQQLPLIAFSDAFHDNLAMHKLMISRTGLKKPLLSIIEPSGLPHYDGPLAARTQPGKMLKPLPDSWVNPFSNKSMNLTFDEVVAAAVQTGALCVTAVMRYWLGDFSEDKLIAVLGNNDYYTGMPLRPAKEKAGAPDGESENADATATAEEPAPQ